MAKGDKHTIIIMPKDAEGVNYLSNDDCALARACKRHFKTNEISVGGTYVRMNGTAKQFDIENNAEDFDWETLFFIQETKEPYPVVLIER